MAGVDQIVGIVTPFQRDRASDIAHGDGARLTESLIRQVAGTEPGELPWRTSFGAGLGRLRHNNNDDVTGELARIRTRDELARWVPDVEITGVTVRRQDTALFIGAKYKAPTIAEGVATVEVQPVQG